MMSRLRVLPYALLALFLLTSAPSAWANKAKTTLIDLIKSSDYIVVAQVKSIKTMNGLRVALAVPQQEFKGVTRQKPFYFVAEETWTCDSSTAIKNETVLLFLNRVSGDVIERGLLLKPSVPVSIKPLFSIAHDGSGRLQLRSVNGKTYITFLTIDVILPRDISSIPGPDARYADINRSVRLSDIAKIIPQKSRPSP